VTEFRYKGKVEGAYSKQWRCKVIKAEPGVILHT
jgi:hypothetical protein